MVSMFMQRTLFIVMLLLALTFVAAQEEEQPFDEWADTPAVTLEGCGTFPTVRVIIDGQETENRGFICNGRTYLAAREILERLGGTVVWMQNEQAFYAQFPEHQRTVRVAVGSRTVRIYAYNNAVRTGAGSEVRTLQLSTAPIICEGRTYAPVRAAAQAVGGSVHYDAQNRIVYITSPHVTSS